MIFARLKQFATSTTVVLSVIFSLGLGTPVAAMSAVPMAMSNHEHTTATNCIDLHHVAYGVSEKVSTNEFKQVEDDSTPYPLSYFLEFQQAPIEQQLLAPDDIARCASFVPPDIIRLTNNIRF